MHELQSGGEGGGGDDGGDAGGGAEGEGGGGEGKGGEGEGEGSQMDSVDASQSPGVCLYFHERHVDASPAEDPSWPKKHRQLARGAEPMSTCKGRATDIRVRRGVHRCQLDLGGGELGAPVSHSAAPVVGHIAACAVGRANVLGAVELAICFERGASRNDLPVQCARAAHICEIHDPWVADHPFVVRRFHIRIVDRAARPRAGLKLPCHAHGDGPAGVLQPAFNASWRCLQNLNRSQTKGSPVSITNFDATRRVPMS